MKSFLLFLSFFMIFQTDTIIKPTPNSSPLSEKPNHSTKKSRMGTYKNIDSTKFPKFKDLLRWQFSKNPQKEEKKKDNWRPQIVSDTSFLISNQDVIVWLGHATFFIRINGIQIITDPIFENIIMLKRLIKLPISPEKFNKINYILISHNHRDHCDKKSIKLLCKNNPNAKILTGEGMKELIQGWVKNEIQEQTWFNNYNTVNKINIIFTPAQHWSKRSMDDTNKTLWGGFYITSTKTKIFFAGDTGYSSHFKLISEKLGPPDICLMPIGAYSPQWFMKTSHTSPEDAVKGFNEMQGKIFIPMHYATFDLTDEPVSEPIQLLKALNQSDSINGKLEIINPGKAFLF